MVFSSSCKGRQIHVYSFKSDHECAMRMANDMCLANLLLAPLQKRREARAVASGQASRLRGASNSFIEFLSEWKAMKH